MACSLQKTFTFNSFRKVGCFSFRPLSNTSRLFLRSCSCSASKVSDPKFEAVVVVESPSKAKKLQTYLGPDYSVIASYGHVCDLPKNKAVDPNNSFSVRWEVNFRGKAQLTKMAQLLQHASKMILATDPDREGEAISWHVVERLKEFTSLDTLSIQRITFTEISKAAVLQSMNVPREVKSKVFSVENIVFQIDMNLVHAYLARRVIDYLLGFTVSPVLWRKLPGARSAGRVQSPCLRLICEREDEISDFVQKEYWTIEVKLCTKDNNTFVASLSHVDERSITKLNPLDEIQAEEVKEKIQKAKLVVSDVSQKASKKRPLAPYRTSTLLQDASRRLKWNGERTMRVAQHLYEGKTSSDNNQGSSGLITYMRTDGVNISNEAIQDIRKTINSRFGSHFLPSEANYYSKKVLNAQEAHEAIRPTDVTLVPDKLPSSITTEEWQLYQMIWQRTVASQMEDAQYKQHSIIVNDDQNSLQLRASESELIFKGFLEVFSPDLSDESSSGDTDDEDKTSRLTTLTNLKKGEEISQKEVQKLQHFTKPPPRYNEASIVKTLEELGIGRPSTFALITSLLLKRRYAFQQGKAYVPAPLGQVLTLFLDQYFLKFVDYEFTSSMEERLDDIAEGKEKWKTVAQEFWDLLTPYVHKAYETQVRDVVDYVNAKMLDKLFFPLVEEGSTLEETKKCPSCVDGQLLIRLSKNGPFLGCSNYSKTGCIYSISINRISQGFIEEGVVQDLGHDDVLGGQVVVSNKMGRSYIELITVEPKLGRKVPIPTRKYDINAITLEKARRILKPLKELGIHPKSGMPITIEKGKAYTRYLKHGDLHVELNEEIRKNWNSLDLETAVKILAHRDTKKQPSKKQSPKKQASEKKPSKKQASEKQPPKKQASKEASGVKRARSAYVLFCMEKWDLVKEKNPSDLSSQILPKLAAMWKEITPEEKEKFQHLAARDKIRYQEEIKQEQD